MPKAELCDDHLNGWTPRYSGKQPPRFGCPECYKIYQGEAPSGADLELKNFSKQDEHTKQRILLGEERFKIVFFDLECTHLKPNVGRMLCCSFKPLGGQVYTFGALERRFKEKDVYDDSKLALAIRNELEKYDIIVGHNSKMFDTKFLNSRLIRAGHRTKPAQYQVDTMWSWRSKFSAWSGLDNVQKFALPDAETTKTSVDWPQWMRALGWNAELARKAMDEITDHCERDVTVLEDVYRLLVRANAVRSIRRDGGVL
jgi:uncharacterized protein YprB with RNaseH-like and TPR domain